MQQGDARVPVQEVFGSAVAAERARRGWSQRDLAAQLTSAGFPVDASAVSRVESGARSLRLNEAMIVAQVLGEDITYLLHTGSSQQRELAALRAAADLATQELRQAVVRFRAAHLSVKRHLDENPDSLARLGRTGATTLRQPSSAAEYFAWAADRMEQDEFAATGSEREMTRSPEEEASISDMFWRLTESVVPVAAAEIRGPRSV